MFLRIRLFVREFFALRRCLKAAGCDPNSLLLYSEGKVYFKFFDPGREIEVER